MRTIDGQELTATGATCIGSRPSAGSCSGSRSAPCSSASGFMQNVLSYSAFDVGFAILPAGGFMVLVAASSARLVHAYVPGALCSPLHGRPAELSQRYNPQEPTACTCPDECHRDWGRRSA